MKRFVLFAAGLALCASDLAIAQQGQQQDRPRPERPNRPDRPTTKPAPPQVRPERPNPGRPNPGRPDRPDRPNPNRPDRPTTKPVPPHVQPVRPGNGHRPGVRPPGGWHRPPHRPGFRPPNFRPIRGPVFRWPRGYRYHRWTIGVLLPSLFLGSSYYFNDYGRYGFGAPPYGYRWVRYGPDLVLVNLRTRRIRDIIYGAFY